MALTRNIPDSFNPQTVSAIDDLLAKIVADETVCILHAIESGSRAWGFPSPDSDYDCRFLFVRRIEAYLSPWQMRDVIETPLIGDLDVNGWELGKALKLMLKGNAVVLEWLTSPILYQSDPKFAADMMELASRTAPRDGLARHYLHLGLRQWQTYFRNSEAGALKKLFYALRPAMALRWLRKNADRSIPPMYFPSLLEECDSPSGMVAICKDLIAQKAITKELGDAPVPTEVRAFLESEFEIAAQHWPSPAPKIPLSHKVEVAAFFKATVERASSGA